MSGPFPFELSYKGRRWRVERSQYKGEWRLNVWPWFPADNEWRRCNNPNGEKGFVLKRDRIRELANVLIELADTLPPDGTPG